MKRLNLLMILVVAGSLVACGDDDGGTDAGTDVPMADTPMTDTPETDTPGTDVPVIEDPDPTCENYCTTVMANCTDANAQYLNMDQCMTYCGATAGAWEAGTKADDTGNTIACRITFANNRAASNPAAACPTAGPTGNNICGTWCENYCDVLMQTCTGSDAVYDSPGACMTACDMFDDSGLPGATDGDSVQCRLYHGGIPATINPAMHCPHARPESAMDTCAFDDMGYDFNTAAPSTFTQNDRTGMPAITTALIDTDGFDGGPASTITKAEYNAGNPTQDGALDFAGELLENLTIFHGALDGELVDDLGLVPCSMADPGGGALPECVSQEVAPGVSVASLVIPDVISLDLTAPAQFPNGRLLDDQVIDITLAIILLRLSEEGQGARTFADLPLNPSMNDVPFLDAFPYLAEAN